MESDKLKLFLDSHNILNPMKSGFRTKRRAVVEPTPKKPSLDPSQPENYRPMSKLPFLSKILEEVVAEQLPYFLEKHDF